MPSSGFQFDVSVGPGSIRCSSLFVYPPVGHSFPFMVLSLMATLFGVRCADLYSMHWLCRGGCTFYFKSGVPENGLRIAISDVGLLNLAGLCVCVRVCVCVCVGGGGGGGFRICACLIYVLVCLMFSLYIFDCSLFLAKLMKCSFIVFTSLSHRMLTL